jgi:hypothetical protein
VYEAFHAPLRRFVLARVAAAAADDVLQEIYLRIHAHSGAKSRVQPAREKLKDMLLNCCHFEFDRYGGILDYQARCCCCVTGSASSAITFSAGACPRC